MIEFGFRSVHLLVRSICFNCARAIFLSAPPGSCTVFTGITLEISGAVECQLWLPTSGKPDRGLFFCDATSRRVDSVEFVRLK